MWCGTNQSVYINSKGCTRRCSPEQPRKIGFCLADVGFESHVDDVDEEYWCCDDFHAVLVFVVALYLLTNLKGIQLTRKSRNFERILERFSERQNYRIEIFCQSCARHDVAGPCQGQVRHQSVIVFFIFAFIAYRGI